MARLAAIMSSLTLAGVAALIYLAFFENVVPMRSERLVAVEGLAIGPSAHIVITREICFARDNEAQGIRIFKRQDDDNEPGRDDPEEVYEAPVMLVHFEAGCNVRSRRMDPPSQLRTGRYTYEAGLRYFNDLGRYQTVWLTPFEVIVQGEGDRRLYRVRPITSR